MKRLVVLAPVALTLTTIARVDSLVARLTPILARLVRRTRPLVALLQKPPPPDATSALDHTPFVLPGSPALDPANLNAQHAALVRMMDPSVHGEAAAPGEAAAASTAQQQRQQQLLRAGNGRARVQPMSGAGRQRSRRSPERGEQRRPPPPTSRESRQRPHGEYAARVHDPHTYDVVSRDIIARWSFPLVPDANLFPELTQFTRVEADGTRVAAPGAYRVHFGVGGEHAGAHGMGYAEHSFVMA